MNNELHHYGILGMKWGVRRYVNEDGTLTDKGKKRYSKRHGVGKYLYDTNKVRQRKRKIASASIGVADAAMTGYGLVKFFRKHHDPNTPTTVPALAAAYTFILGTSALSGGLNYMTVNSTLTRRNIRDLERHASIEDINRATRYLESQGVSINPHTDPRRNRRALRRVYNEYQGE